MKLKIAGKDRIGRAAVTAPNMHIILYHLGAIANYNIIDAGDARDTEVDLIAEVNCHNSFK